MTWGRARGAGPEPVREVVPRLGVVASVQRGGGARGGSRGSQAVLGPGRVRPGRGVGRGARREGRGQPAFSLPLYISYSFHTTFVGPGYAVCSFVPRVVDFHKDAIPCPYPHSSVDCDEIILYLRGNFTSRRGVGPGCISLHPSGVARGPHPGAYEASIGAVRTDEMAVMVDTFRPLAALGMERADYHDSWKNS